MDDLFISKITFNLDNCDGFYKELFEGVGSIGFKKAITFFSGENGSGKSTLLEAIAIQSGLNKEGGTRNYSFETFDDTSELYKHIRLSRSSIAKSSMFFRAESFYNLATKAIQYAEDIPYEHDNLHNLSHGQSFLSFITSYTWKGLYLMDEPEAALSPTAQMSLLCHIHSMARRGSQFIIATHSPILLGTPDSEILDFDNGMEEIEYQKTQSYILTRRFLDNRENVLKNLLSQ